jgi:hypothetical protein
VACPLSGPKLLGPEYFAENDGCCCRMVLIWPEIQKRSQNEDDSVAGGNGAGAELSATGVS